MTLKDKLDNLENILKSYNRITVALSGGVDSAFLLAFSSKVLGAENVKALTAKGPHLAPDERDYARELCAALGIDHKIIDMDHIMSIISPNPTDRCYHCKKAIFSELKALSDDTLADGTNLDDMNDYRPGHKALAELKIASPLKDAGLTKNEIREALEEKEKVKVIRKELSEERKEELNRKIQNLCKGDKISVEYFSTGEYITVTDRVIRVDDYRGRLILENEVVFFRDICELDLL